MRISEFPHKYSFNKETTNRDHTELETRTFKGTREATITITKDAYKRLWAEEHKLLCIVGTFQEVHIN